MAADYKSTVFLPRTDFPMRGSLPEREPELLARWEKLGLYQRQREAAKGHGCKCWGDVLLVEGGGHNSFKSFKLEGLVPVGIDLKKRGLKRLRWRYPHAGSLPELRLTKLDKGSKPDVPFATYLWKLSVLMHVFPRE